MRPAASRFALGALAASALLGAFAACSSKQGTLPGDGGLVGTPQSEIDGAVVVYPTAHVGTAQRGLVNGTPGTTPGSVIPNFKFLGYPNADESQGLQTITLADYYDPTASKHKVLHIMAVAEWCDPCNTETSELIADLQQTSTNFEAQGVAYMQALIEGHTINTGATQTDLNDWITTQKPPFTEVLDPEAEELGVLFQASEVPFSATVDVRSMELLQAGTGQEDPTAITVWIDWVNNNPPAYTP